MSDEPDGLADSDPADVSSDDAVAGGSAVEPTDLASSAGSTPLSDPEPRGRARTVRLGKDSTESPEDAIVEPETGTDTDTDADRETAVVGAATAGSARAAARRSVARTATTPAKGTATRPRDVDREVHVGMFSRLSRFLREVVAELRKVIWPARNQMITYTIVVIVFVVIMIALVSGLDVLFAKGVLWIFG